MQGLGPISRFDALRVEDWDAMIDVNLRGTLYGIAAALPVFQRRQSGHIINIVSTAGIKILPTMGVYAATKNAVRTITEALRQESGPHLRVTEISPGMISTNFADLMTDPAVKEAMGRRIGHLAIRPMLSLAVSPTRSSNLPMWTSAASSYGRRLRIDDWFHVMDRQPLPASLGKRSKFHDRSRR